jgi:hypothetical protein
MFIPLKMGLIGIDPYPIEIVAICCFFDGRHSEVIDSIRTRIIPRDTNRRQPVISPSAGPEIWWFEIWRFP